MATVSKDFKVKNGLIVEGTTATVNNYDVLTKKQDDQDYIVSLIGGTSTSQNTPNTVVKRDGSGNFAAGTITADLTGNVTGQVSDISNHNTDDLSEGSANKYFTNQRAINANTGLWDEAGSAASAQNAAETYADGLISTEVTNRNNAIATAKSEAISTSESYTDSSISTEVTNRNSAISSAISTEVTNRNSAIATAKSEAISTSESYTDSAISTEVTNRNSAIATAKQQAIDTAASDATTKANAAENNAKAYTDTEIAALVDSAPAMLDTLNELAQAIANNPNYATDVANLVATKADTTYVDSQDQYYDGLAVGYANTAQSNAEGYTDSSISTEVTNRNNAITSAISTEVTNRNTAIATAKSEAISVAESYTDTEIATEVTNRNNAITSAINTEVTNRNNAIATAKSEAISTSEGYTDNAINALTTSDIEEGSNLYYTDNRAKDAAGYLLENSTQSNIVISYDEGTRQLTVTAEDGFAGHNTNDLSEGSTNLYFTNARAVSALEAVVPNFTEIDIHSVATQVAATTGNIATASTVTAYSFAKADYRSAKFLVKCAYSTHTEVSEVLLTLDSSDNIAITEYAIVGTNGSSMNISADVNGGNVRLRVATVNNNSTLTVVGTLVA